MIGAIVLRAGCALAIGLGALAGAHPAAAGPGTPDHPAAEAAPTSGVAPVLAYYYIWYNPTSWQRAKSDYPLLGRYSSDDAEVMRRHVAMAKSAGITGFLVSWKHAEVLDQRLDQLVEISRKQGFKLGIIYQGLDFSRKPLPVQRIADDLQYFATRYAREPVFDIFGKPAIAVTGTEQFPIEALRQISDPVRNQLLVLGSAKSVEDYIRSAPALDGNAYYWSSAAPTTKAYTKRLKAVGEAVHRHGGLWFAPAATGFDARLLGGKQVIERRNGETLRRGVGAARSSEPDAIAVISWNEFSENSHLEPSERYGKQSLTVLADILGAKAVIDVPQDSSEAASAGPSLTGWGAIAVFAALVGLLNAAVLFRRRKKRLSKPRGVSHTAAGTSVIR